MKLAHTMNGVSSFYNDFDVDEINLKDDVEVDMAVSHNVIDHVMESIGKERQFVILLGCKKTT